MGSHSILLINIGCGLFYIKPIIDCLIGNKNLIVINTHSNWDYVGGNHEFNEVHIHKLDVILISKSLNLSLLKDSLKDIVNQHNTFSFYNSNAPIIKPLKEKYTFGLGGIKLRIFLTSGHSNGSISLLTNKYKQFTGDTAHYGAFFLLKMRILLKIKSSLIRLIKL